MRARILIGCYRRDDAADPEVYAGALVAILTGYPEEIVLTVTDPRTGIAGRSQWLPTIAEVRSACEKEATKRFEIDRRQSRSDDVLALPPMSAEDAERRKAVVRKWRQEMEVRKWADETLNPPKLYEMDVRQCKGDLRDRVEAAANAHIAELVEKYKSTPVKLSREALKAIGRDVVASHEQGAA